MRLFLYHKNKINQDIVPFSTFSRNGQLPNVITGDSSDIIMDIGKTTLVEE